MARRWVAERLRDRDTRSATLAALESHPATTIPTAVSLAAAPALLGLMTMDAAGVERDAYDRAGLLLARLSSRRLLLDRSAMRRAAAGGKQTSWQKAWTAAAEATAAHGGEEGRDEAAAEAILSLLPRGTPLTAALWARIQPGVAWPTEALHGAVDEATGETRWVVDGLQPRRRRPWVLALARAALLCSDDDMRDDALAAA